MIPVDVISGWATIMTFGICVKCHKQTEIVDPMSELYFCAHCLLTAYLQKVEIKDVESHQRIRSIPQEDRNNQLHWMMSQSDIGRYNAAMLMVNYEDERLRKLRRYDYNTYNWKCVNDIAWACALLDWSRFVMLTTYE